MCGFISMIFLREDKKWIWDLQWYPFVSEVKWIHPQLKKKKKTVITGNVRSVELACEAASTEVQMGHVQVAGSGSSVPQHYLSPGSLYDTGPLRDSLQYSFFNAVVTQALHFTLLNLSNQKQSKQKENKSLSGTDAAYIEHGGFFYIQKCT